jgi:hypothetical protein
MKILKILGVSIGVLALIVASGAYYTLKTFKNFSEYDVTLESIKSNSAELSGHIEKIVSFGMRNPGTEGDIKTRDYILDTFAGYNLDVREPDTFDIKMYHPSSWSFSLSDSSGRDRDIPAFYMPFTAATESNGLTAPLVYVEDMKKLEEMDIKGRIAVYDMRFKPKPIKTYGKLLFMHDPDITIDSAQKVLGRVTEYETKMYEALKKKGAVGMVGLLSGLQWDTDRFYPQMSFGLEKSIPGVWIKPSLCDDVRAIAQKEGSTGTLKMDSSISTGTTANIYAVLPGQIDEYYLVLGHHDTYFNGAVQDASGISVILGLAKHFASTDKPLKRGIVFLSVAHTNGRKGEKDFVKNHLNGILSKTALVVAIEHIGKELDPRPDLTFAVSDLPSFRMFFTALNDKVNGMVKSSILKHDYRRSVIVPQWLVEKITGKSRGISAEFHEVGLPVINFMSNPPYMFYPEDTMEVVATDQLVPTANVIASILRTADNLSKEDLR